MAAGDSSLSRLPIFAKAGIIVGLVGLIGVAYYVVFFGDIASRIKAAQGQERSLHQELTDARKNEFAYHQDLAELADREQRLPELVKKLPTSSDYPAFLSSIQNAANIAAVSLTAWTPQDEVPEQFYARVPMRLELRGRFHQVAKFFYNVGQLDRIINMENISISDPTVNGDEIDVKVEVLATAFRLLETASKADARGASAGGAK